MTDQTSEERDEHEAGEAARGPTEREEEGKPYMADEAEPDEPSEATQGA
jgi:hypothetical protein